MAGSLAAATIIFAAISIESFLVVLFIFMDGVLYHAKVVNNEDAKSNSDESMLITSNLCRPDITSIATASLATDITIYDTTVEQIRETTTAIIESSTTNASSAWDCVPRHGVYAGDLNVTRDGHPCVPWQEMWDLAEDSDAWFLMLRLVPAINFFHETVTSVGNKCRNRYNSTTEFACFYYDEVHRGYDLSDCDIRTCEEVDLDECFPNLCLNGATCVDEPYGYHCVCPELYTGDRCELQIGACHENGRYTGNLSMTAFGTPCLNWELAFISVPEYDITLFPDDLTWADVGSKCRHPFETHEDTFCFVHAPSPQMVESVSCSVPACPEILESRCSAASGEPDCIPRHGVYAGDLTEDCDGNPCAEWRWVIDAVQGQLFYLDDIGLYPDESWEALGNKCRNPGYLYTTPWCIIVNNDRVEMFHDCNAGFCEDDVDECSPNLCVNGGTCVDGRFGYSCRCPDGFQGDNCQLVSGECRVRSMPSLYEGGLRFANNGQPCVSWEIVVEYGVEIGTQPLEWGHTCRYPWEWPGEYRPFCFITVAGGDIQNRPCAIPLCPEICSESDPCLNGGMCRIDGTQCDCRSGFEGPVCETDLDECSSDPCENGATCEDLVNGFSCHCTELYDGTTCDREILPCDNSPCLRGGECTNGVDNGENIFTCQCLPGYVGDVCQTDVDECASNPCQNGGQCNDALNSYTCQCEHPFTGDFCEREIFPCDSNPCQHSSTCTNGDSVYTCQCPPGFIGDHCETEIDECASNPCQHGGRCSDAVNGFTCECDYPYNGDSCQTEATCFPRGAPKHLYKTTTSQTTFNEQCIPWATAMRYRSGGEDFRYMLGLQHFPDDTWEEASNYCRNPTQEDEGPWCMYGTNSFDWWYCAIQYCPSETADDCWPNPCLNGGTCVDGVDSFTCECDNGYSGVYCQTGDCYSTSMAYTGRTNHGWSGRPCINWEGMVEIGVEPDYILDYFPDVTYSEVSNNCRRYGSGEPMCFTLQYRDYERTYVPENCGIPQCTLPDCRIEGGIYAGSFTMEECWHWEDVYRLDILTAQTGSYLPSFPDPNYHMLGKKCRNPTQASIGEFCMGQVGDALDRFACDIPECTDGDACTVNPCLNGGTCVIGGSGGEGVAYSCQCPDGYHGALCESGDCRFLQRVYEGTLSVTENGYACLPWTLVNQVIPNFLDDTDVDPEAARDYCRSPFELNGRPFCFVQKDLEITRDHCLMPACEGENDCVQEGVEYTGEATLGICRPWHDVYSSGVDGNPLTLDLFPESSWSELGAKCRNPTNFERGEWCPILENGIQLIVCHVPECPETLSRCSRDPCMNGATCVDEDESFTCQCPDGYTGDLCETGDCYQFHDYYTGNTARSTTGKRCYPWVDLESPSPAEVGSTFYFESSFEAIGNRCRNRLDSFGVPPLCYVYDDRELVLEECNVPQCPSTECVVPGVPYAGDAQFSRCIPWADISLWTDVIRIRMVGRLSNFPDASFEELGAKCRNPNEDPEGEWCLIATSEEMIPHYCRLPTCSGITPCSQNPCLNGATCVDQQDGGYTCSCADGYLGVLCESGDCIDGRYSGDTSISMGGRPCQYWTDVLEYMRILGVSQTYAMPDPFEAGNKCRDALLLGPDAPWCAVFDGGHFSTEMCALPPCPGATTECVKMSAIPKYSGTISVIASGQPCVPWSTLDSIPNMPEYAVLDGEFDDDQNYCRDVTATGRPICMGVLEDGTQVTSYCVVPMCAAYLMDDCSPNYCMNGGTCVDGHATFTCTCPPGYWGELCESNECVTGDGSDYSGDLSMSSVRRPCVNWFNYLQYSDSDDFQLHNFPDQTWEQVGKKCRNPDSSRYSVPFCIVQTLPHVHEEKFVISECALPQC